MTGWSPVRARCYAVPQPLSPFCGLIRLSDMKRFTGSRPMTGNPVVSLPVRGDPGAGRRWVIGRRRVVRRCRVVGGWWRHDDGRDIDADTPTIGVPPGVCRLGSRRDADDGEAQNGAGGGELAGGCGDHCCLPCVSFCNVVTLRAADRRGIWETSLAGFE